MRGRLILFPVAIGCDDLGHSLPPYNKVLLDGCRHFIVEELRTARRFLRHCGYAHAIDDATFYLLNEHTDVADTASYLDAIERGEDLGLLSEAGVPCVADPGMAIARMAQQRGIEVVPLVGPSSLLLSLMASGLNGQAFAFHGYLPIERDKRAAAIRNMEQRIYRDNQTQIFIEAPYRNNQMLQALTECCRPETMICVACDITLETQQIVTRTAREWRSHAINLHKRNTVFLLGR